MDDKEKLAQMVLRCGLATGHADTMDDLVDELETQIMKLRQQNAALWRDIGVLRNALQDGKNIEELAAAIAKATGGE